MRSTASAGRLCASEPAGCGRLFSPEIGRRGQPARCLMELKLYDTLAREKRLFTPLDWEDSAIPPAARRVRMYACGPTVYDFVHIGNGRMAVVFDVLFRLLRHLYGAEHVVYVRNVTDVDDKINARAAERGIAIRDLTEETYRYYRDDVAALGCLRPTVEPRATEHIAEMKTLIERLVADGHAYVAEEHVLFDVPSMRDYGQLSRRSLDEMIAGARVDVAPYKRDPQDFVLWKPSKPGEPADRKSTRLNSSHVRISYAVFCLKKKKKTYNTFPFTKKKKKLKYKTK